MGFLKLVQYLNIIYFNSFGFDQTVQEVFYFKPVDVHLAIL